MNHYRVDNDCGGVGDDEGERCQKSESDRRTHPEVWALLVSLKMLEKII